MNRYYVCADYYDKNLDNEDGTFGGCADVSEEFDKFKDAVDFYNSMCYLCTCTYGSAILADAQTSAIIKQFAQSNEKCSLDIK